MERGQAAAARHAVCSWIDRAVTGAHSRAVHDMRGAGVDTNDTIETGEDMAVHMVKVAYEGLVTKALKNSEEGPTSGGTVVYAVEGVPADITLDDVIAAVKKVGGKPIHKDHVVKWSDLMA